jgi:hypothetical protein
MVNLYVYKEIAIPGSWEQVRSRCATNNSVLAAGDVPLSIMLTRINWYDGAARKKNCPSVTGCTKTSGKE